MHGVSRLDGLGLSRIQPTSARAPSCRHQLKHTVVGSINSNEPTTTQSGGSTAVARGFRLRGATARKLRLTQLFQGKSRGLSRAPGIQATRQLSSRPSTTLRRPRRRRSGPGGPGREVSASPRGLRTIIRRTHTGPQKGRRKPVTHENKTDRNKRFFMCDTQPGHLRLPR